MKDFYDDGTFSQLGRPIALVMARVFLARQMRLQLTSLGYRRVSIASPVHGQTPDDDAALYIVEDDATVGQVLDNAAVDPAKVILVAANGNSAFGLRQRNEAADILGQNCGHEELRLKLDRYFRTRTMTAPPGTSRDLIAKTDLDRLVKAARAGQSPAFVLRLVARDGCAATLHDFASTCRAIVGENHPMGHWAPDELRMLLRVKSFDAARDIAKAVDISTSHLPQNNMDGAPIRVFLRKLNPKIQRMPSHDDHLLAMLRSRASLGPVDLPLAG